MLLVAKIREEFHAVLPAITHEDGTGRVQTCTSDANPFFYNLCLEIDKLREGPPVLLNTSFNVAGQPIVPRHRKKLLQPFYGPISTTSPSRINGSGDAMSR